MKRPRKASTMTVQSLTRPQREVLELRVRGLSWTAIAKEMRRSPSTVRQHYAYGMEKVRRRFGREDKKELRK